jgi:hypothetical protein
MGVDLLFGLIAVKKKSLLGAAFQPAYAEYRTYLIH